LRLKTTAPNRPSLPNEESDVMKNSKNEEYFIQQQTFEGPIEAGKTTPPVIGQQIEPGQEVCSDNFKVISNCFDTKDIKTVILPKFITNLNSGIKEHGFILISFNAKNNPRVYNDVMDAVDNGIEVFEIHFFKDKKQNNLKFIWKFEDPRVHAVDFGYIAKARSDNAEVSVEIDYKSMEMKFI
jgi:hypothetical protein